MDRLSYRPGRTGDRYEDLAVKTLLITAAIVTSGAASAGTAFFSYEIAPPDARTKVCMYQYMGSPVAITIPALTRCPTSVPFTPP